ncbi:hypothetical protein ACF3NW_04780 [Eikenella halliae]|uniref:hypothetical protein n=1 Tax=Eikenella halliae TaxID=1795832 RepID=UPI0028D2F58D|nr:hypothetical protein [Eikenella halliae]
MKNGKRWKVRDIKDERRVCLADLLPEWYGARKRLPENFGFAGRKTFSGSLFPVYPTYALSSK